MSLIQIKNLSVAYGIKPLLDKANLVISAGERIGLLGRNGEGKSTLLRILAQERPFDDGEINGLDQIKIAKLDQAPSLSGDDTVFVVVASGLGPVGLAVADFRQATIDNDSGALADAQDKVEQLDGWLLFNRIEQTITRLGLDPDILASTLSGGWQRRVSLAKALVTDPDLLLLDEPTNHLDTESIQWLESHLINFSGALVFVTHDRSFLRKIATQIVDLDRGKLTSWQGTYDNYLERKAQALENEQQQNHLFDKKLAQEEQWIRQGVKARRTRNEGRVRALKELRKQRSQRRDVQKTAVMSLQSAQSSGKRVIKAHNLCYSITTDSGEHKVLVEGLSTEIQKQDRIGLIGPNGVGKSTLIKLLLGELEPDAGKIQHGTNLDIAYFDQLRNKLDGKKTISEFIGEGREEIQIGNKTKHVISYLQDFLFTPERARTPIRSLSGGEKARVLLAHLFSKPVNCLVLDEPTNDLDIETLELLEELINDFNGTIILVSHDRAFMDNVVTSSLVFTGNGHVEEFFGGFSDWQKYQQLQAKQQKAEDTAKAKLAAASKVPVVKSEKNKAKKLAATPTPAKPKLSYKLQRELDELPVKIEALEQQQARLSAQLLAPDFYQNHSEEAVTINQQISVITEQLETLVERWAELES